MASIRGGPWHFVHVLERHCLSISDSLYPVGTGILPKKAFNKSFVEASRHSTGQFCGIPLPFKPDLTETGPRIRHLPLKSDIPLYPKHLRWTIVVGFPGVSALQDVGTYFPPVATAPLPQVLPPPRQVPFFPMEVSLKALRAQRILGTAPLILYTGIRNSMALEQAGRVGGVRIVGRTRRASSRLPLQKRRGPEVEDN